MPFNSGVESQGLGWKLRQWGVAIIIFLVVSFGAAVPAIVVHNQNTTSADQQDRILANQRLVQDVLNSLRFQQAQSAQNLQIAVTAATKAITCVLLIPPESRTDHDVTDCLDSAFKHK